MTEIWKPIPFYEGRYEASSLGNIRSYWFDGAPIVFPRIMSMHKSRGYSRVALINPATGKQQTRKVCRLVLMAFAGWMPDMDASHLDGDRSNDIPSNLIWESRGDNNRRKTIHDRQTRGERNSQAKITEAQAIEIKSLKGCGLNARAVGGRFAISKSQVLTIWRGHSWAYLDTRHSTGGTGG